MRKGLLVSLTLVGFAMGALGYASSVNAAGVGGACVTNAACDSGLSCVAGRCSVEIDYGSLNVNSSNPTVPTYTPTQNYVNPGSGAGSSVPSGQTQNNNGQNGNLPTDLKEAESGILASVIQWIVKLFAWLLGVAALLLDAAVYYTVVKMGTYVQSLPAVGTVWRIMRDLGNIILIFGFLAIGIATILQADWYGNRSKALPMLLVAAVFLNFSLFISQAVIDTGNLFASQFYTQINGGQQSGQKFQGADAIAREGISNKVMGQLGLTNIYNAAKENKDLYKTGNVWIVGFMSIILFLIAAFVFFSLAFILIARFVILLFLIILSPIGFAGLAVPKLEGYAKQWWGKLFEQTITAPVLLLLLYIALKIITDTQFLTGLCGVEGGACATSSWTGFVEGGDLTGFMVLLLAFFIAMGLLLFVTIAAKNLSAAGAGGAMKLAGKATFGATAWGMRNTVGAGANWAGKNLRKTAFARVPLVGTGLVKGLDKAAKGSFDLRAASIGGTKLLKDLPYGGIDAGDAQKGGYKESLKNSIESRTKYAADLKGKDFKDLSSQEQFELAQLQADLAKAKKDQQQAKTPEDYSSTAQTIKEKEKAIEEFNKNKGTEMGNKLKYAETLSSLVLSSNTEAAKKIKEEAKKGKEDKDLDALRKALKKAGGEDEGHGEKKAEGGGGHGESAAKPAGGGGGGAPKGGDDHPH